MKIYKLFINFLIYKRYIKSMRRVTIALTSIQGRPMVFRGRLQVAPTGKGTTKFIFCAKNSINAGVPCTPVLRVDKIFFYPSVALRVSELSLRESDALRHRRINLSDSNASFPALHRKIYRTPPKVGDSPGCAGQSPLTDRDSKIRRRLSA